MKELLNILAGIVDAALGLALGLILRMLDGAVAGVVGMFAMWQGPRRREH